MSTEEPTPKPKRKWLRRVFIASQVVLGLGLGLVIAEKVFADRYEGAFPHVNFYVEDPELGVRLEPGATMKFRLRNNPLSTINVNAQGYRGADWPAAGTNPGEIIVLGDSQVFGLGVNDDETFSAQLAAITSRPVLNAGVPTYGPPEYLALAKELLEQRKPAVVVLTINFLNDAFEIDRPNKDRHTVWDGWAVRAEHAPTEVRQFPGRKWLYSQSHAFYAFRRWRHERGKAELPDGEEQVDLGTPSEGRFEDLVVTSITAHAQHDAELDQAKQALDASRERISEVDEELRSNRDQLDDLVREASEYEFGEFERDVTRGEPGDIVDEDFGEEGRSVLLTAGLIRKAARQREAHLQKLLRKQERKGETQAKDLIQAEEQLLAERHALREQIAAGVPLVPPPTSVFDAYLQELKALCDEHGAELVLVALPVDVQVDASEWDKYGVSDRPDMSESLVLLRDLVDNAEQHGIRSLDATEALRGAEPGAFLDHDIHMTAKGHAAVGGALAVRLASGLPVALPGGGLPEGLSFVPARDEWSPTEEVNVAGSTKAGCATQIEGDWLRVRCVRKDKRDGFGAIELIEGGTPATMLVHNRDGLTLTTPLTIGAPVTARFHFAKQIRELQIRWPLGDDGKPKFVGTFVDVEGQPKVQEPAAALAPLCTCYEKTAQEFWCLETYPDGEAHQCQESCGGLWGDPALIESCTRSFGDNCGRLLSCVQNDPLTAPECPEGAVHAFASNACFAACDDGHPCKSGTCTPWQGGSVCAP
ncbi:hypothetical protein DB30_03185 [Enhygromyxa salina]|uniref:AlgX/AlgJ SGNH hydrolase-like domain-containing protein n=1 Tax=Enhygromyxa salina TaxID=215803 RepID=A0A0C1ZIX2_9BACT|nr:hypothetical protein [Enhygromyxa salina]KIG17484.1 hypothetical protein DB30_03185 [Enhygromyxa salina]